MEMSAIELAHLVKELQSNQSDIVCPDCNTPNVCRNEFCEYCATPLTLKGLVEQRNKDFQDLREENRKLSDEIYQQNLKLIELRQQASASEEQVRARIVRDMFATINDIVERHNMERVPISLQSYIQIELAPRDAYFNEVPSDKKIATIKAVRELLGLHLGEAKDLVESNGTIKVDLNYKQFEEVVKHFAHIEGVVIGQK